ncbi:ImmA/IrrE family metallo-endopeptidase [Mesorhizobium sp. M1339]|uniref:ImmA/IrrE family metallo-endopeptidase n=1 Tax=Mesorhizobium sp. M1339 TaxID=2957086 RepID=UPI003335F470
MADSLRRPEFQPEWAVAPGATIAACLNDRAVSREAFASTVNESVDTVQRLLLGLVAIDENLAGKLAAALGSSSLFWLKREQQYRSDVDRCRTLEADQIRLEWVRQLPAREMVRLGWIPAYQDASEAAVACLGFFGVPDVATWKSRYAAATKTAAFRLSATSKSNPASVIAWLRWAELIAGRTPCAKWDPGVFRDRLIEIRRLTWQKDPSTFLPHLRRLCAGAGVAIVVARTPQGCPASGATSFLSPEKALMVLSFRYRSDDQFWFTFFHEAGHLLLHGRDALFLEDGSEITSEEELQANAFAGDTLVPNEFTQVLQTLQLDKDSVLRFARHVGIAPGLVVGQLQHKGRLSPDRMNWLKRRYEWDQIQADHLIP